MGNRWAHYHEQIAEAAAAGNVEEVATTGIVTHTLAHTHSGAEAHTGAETHTGRETFVRVDTAQVPEMRTVAAPTAGPTSTGTLTAAQQIARIVTFDLGGAATITTRTGTEIEAALPATVATGDCFVQTWINTSAEDGRIVTFDPGTGVTLVGRATIDAADTPASNPEQQGTFLYRRSAANTFIVYRIA